MADANITEGELVNFVVTKGHQDGSTSISDYPDSFITGWVLKYWKQIVAALNKTANNAD